MSRVPSEQPPTDDIPLQEWLSRMIILINAGLDSVTDYELIYEMPTYQADGMVRCFGSAIAPDISHPGLWLRIGGVWKPLNS